VFGEGVRGGGRRGMREEEEDVSFVGK